jgi:hypothetical protein
LETIYGDRFTPSPANIETAERILELKVKYGLDFKRQYIGHLNAAADSLIYIRLLKKGFKEECFDKIVAFGFGQRYEKYQGIHDVNLTKNKTE